MPRQLGAGRAAQLEIEDLFGLRDVMFVPESMRGTLLERMMIEELNKQAAEARRSFHGNVDGTSADRDKTRR